jgi:hypothetical protein
MNAWPVATSTVLSALTEINQKNVFTGTIRNVGLERTNTNKRS